MGQVLDKQLDTVFEKSTVPKSPSTDHVTVAAVESRTPTSTQQCASVKLRNVAQHCIRVTSAQRWARVASAQHYPRVTPAQHWAEVEVGVESCETMTMSPLDSDRQAILIHDCTLTHRSNGQQWLYVKDNNGCTLRTTMAVR